MLEQRDRVSTQGEAWPVLIRRRLRVVAAVWIYVSRLESNVAHEGEYGRHADRQFGLDGADVQRVGERLFQRQHAVRLLAVVVKRRGAEGVLVDQGARAVIDRRVDGGDAGTHHGGEWVRLARRADV